MRVISGTARGLRLDAPEGLDTRPTMDMVKQAIFNILLNRLETAKVLDLFAGSGQLGIEALSRGAKSAVFVESSRRATEIIRKNLERTGFAPAAQVICGDCLGFLEHCDGHFDIVLCDPPYEGEYLSKSLEIIGRRGLADFVVAETRRGAPVTQAPAGLVPVRTYKYGKTLVLTFARG